MYHDKRSAPRVKKEILEEKIKELSPELKCEAIERGVVDATRGTCVIGVMANDGKIHTHWTIPLNNIDEYYIHNVVEGKEIGR